MDRLFEYADSRGVTYDFVDWLTPQEPGRYYHERCHIDMLTGLSTIATEAVFAHELGHEFLGHERSLFPTITAKQERAADEWAAHFLIDVDEYRYAEEKFGTHTKWIAQELGVLHRLVEVYEKSLHRIGDTVYVKPGLGAAQRRIYA